MLTGRKKRPRATFYAVVKGRNPGVYLTWAECAEQVNEFAGSLFASFPSFDEATEFLNGSQTSNTALISKKPKLNDRITQRTNVAPSPQSPILEFGGYKPQRSECNAKSTLEIDLTQQSCSTPSIKYPKQNLTTIDLSRTNSSQGNSVDSFSTTKYSQHKPQSIHESKFSLKIDLSSSPSKSTEPAQRFSLQKPKTKSSGPRQPIQMTFTAYKPVTNLSPTVRKSKGSKLEAKSSQNLASAAATQQNFEHASLGEDQKNVYDLVVIQGKSVFFTGSAGTGKSFLLRAMITALQAKHPAETVFACASTGVAAIQIGGQTVHRFAGIQLGNKPLPVLIKMAQRKKHWLTCKVLIIDEISMISGTLFDQLDEIARSVRKNSRPFGGIQLVICGDFFQLPPVKRSEKYAFEAESWSSCVPQTIELRKVYRQKENQFIDCLNEIRHGKCSIKHYQFLNQANRPLEVIDGVLPTRLYCTNNSVDNENNRELASINQPKIKLPAIDRTKASLGTNHRQVVFPLIEAAQKVSNIQEMLTLKVGAQVMLLRNMSDSLLVNGSRGVVTGTEKFLYSELENKKLEFIASDPRFDFSTFALWAKESAARALKEPALYEFNEDGILILSLPIVKFINGETLSPVFPSKFFVTHDGVEHWYRAQVPLKLAWAITIHKSQGLSIDRCQLNLTRVFEAGQAYVALSRVLTLEGLELRGFSPRCVFADRKVLSYYAKQCDDPVAKKILE